MRRGFLSMAAVAGVALCGLAAPGHATGDAEMLKMSGRAFEGAQWVMATQAARAVAQMGARAAAGDGPLATMIRQRQQVETDLAQARSGYAEIAGTSAENRSAARDRILDYERTLATLDGDIRAQFPDYAEIANPKPLSYDALRGYLAPDEALILFLSAPQATYVWAVSASGVAWHRAEISAEALSERVRRLRAGLDPTGPARAAVSLSAPSTPEAAAFDMEEARALYADLLAPVAHVLADVDHLLVVKDGALSSLPLAVLLTGPAKVDQPMAQAPWLIRRYALTTLPGVSSLASIRSASAGGGGKAAGRVASFIGFGDPDFRGQDAADEDGQNTVIASRSIGAFFGEGGTRIEAIRRLTPLPGTARELRRIAQLFPENRARVLIGGAATEAAVKTADLEASSILSFATHGLITGDISGLAEPALALTPPESASALDDGLLTASEASQLTLNADWVILSACNTAAGDGTPGAEGLSGLARAFLFAGARSILVSHWPVRDDVAARLTADTLRRLTDDPALGRSQALRLAMLALMADPRDATLADPSAWAPFVVVGEGGALDQ